MCYVNGVAYEKVPAWAIEKMEKRLSETMSRYYAEHPDEYEVFLKGRKEQKEQEGAERMIGAELIKAFLISIGIVIAAFVMDDRDYD